MVVDGLIGSFILNGEEQRMVHEDDPARPSLKGMSWHTWYERLGGKELLFIVNVQLQRGFQVIQQTKTLSAHYFKIGPHMHVSVTLQLLFLTYVPSISTGELGAIRPR